MRTAVRLGFFGIALGALVAVACSDDAPSSEIDADPDAGLPPIRAGAQTSGSDGSAKAASPMRFAHLAADTGPVDFCYQVAGSGTFVGPVLGGPRPTPTPASDGGADAEAADGEAPGGEAIDGQAGLGDPTDAGRADEDAADGGAAGTADGGAGTADEDGGDVEAGTSVVASYGTVTKYLVLGATGAVTLAILPAGSTSCANPIARGDVTLDPSKLSTVALFSRPGDGGAALELAGFTDDRATASDKIRVRVIHAALGAGSEAAPILAVRAIATRTTVLADRVEPRRAATTSEAVSVDGLGYVTAAPIPPPTSLAIGPATTDAGADAGFETWLSQAGDLGLTGGALYTAFVLGGASGARFAVLWCADTITDGDRTTCRWVR